jgi:hypothetical protein
MSYGLVAAGIGAAANIYGASQSASAAGDAGKLQAEAAGAAATRANQITQQARSDYAPYMRSGANANSRLDYLLGLTPYDANAAAQAWRDQIMANGDQVSENWTPNQGDLNAYVKDHGLDTSQSGSLTKAFSADDLNADPVYQSGLKFGLDQGTAAINARATATGNYDSGATLKALTQFGNDYGSTKANDSFNRNMATKQSIYGMLSGQQATGLGATNSTTSAATGGTAAANDYSTQAANARAAGVVGGANAWGGVGNSLSSAYNNYNNNSILQKLLKPASVGTSAPASSFSTDYYAG